MVQEGTWLLLAHMAPEESGVVLGYSHFQSGKQFFLPSSYNSQLSGQEFHYTFDGWKSYKQMPVAGRQEGCYRLSKQKKQKKNFKVSRKTKIFQRVFYGAAPILAHSALSGLMTLQPSLLSGEK